MPSRRDVVLGLGAAALAAPRPAFAQAAPRGSRIAVYLGRQVTDGLVETLRERGWLEGVNLVVDRHAAEGIWMDLPELAGKQIQFLREVMPTLGRLGVVWDDRIGQLQFTELQAVSRRMGITLIPAPLHQTSEIDDVLKRLIAERPQAVSLLTAPVVFLGLRRIAELTAQSRLPSISPFSPYPAAGGLLAYGPDFPAMWRQLASYVDRVLRGARPGNLPVERPSKFSLIVNAKPAKGIGLSLPESLILRADEVIQ